MNSSTISDAEKNFIYIRNVTIISACISSLGFFPNFSIVYVIFKYRSSKLNSNTYSILLGFSCAFDMTQELSTILPMILHIFRWSIPLLSCFAIQWYDVFALNMVYQIMFLIALDRLVAVIFPIEYLNIVKNNARLLVFLALIPPILHIGYYLALMLSNALANANLPVYCQTSDYSRAYTFLGGLIVNFSTIGIYALIWILFKTGRSFHASNRRIFKSLVLITVVHFTCWLIPFSLPFILPLFSMDPISVSITTRFSGMAVRFSAIMNVFIIFICSLEYREMLIKEFKFYLFLANLFELIKIKTKGWIVGRGGGQIQVQAQQSTMYQNS